MSMNMKHRLLAYCSSILLLSGCGQDSISDCDNDFFLALENKSRTEAVEYLQGLQRIGYIAELNDLRMLWDGQAPEKCRYPSGLMENDLFRLTLAGMLVQSRYNALIDISVDDHLDFARSRITLSDYSSEVVAAMGVISWTREDGDIGLISKSMTLNIGNRFVVDSGIMYLSLICTDVADGYVREFLSEHMVLAEDLRIKKMLSTSREFCGGKL